MCPNIIEIRNLSVALSGNNRSAQIILDNIHLDIPAGKVTGIAGESGSGKSLTALSIIRLLPPNIDMVSGEIRFLKDTESIDLAQLKQGELYNIRGKSISMIFQEPMTSLNPSLTCGFQVGEALKIHENIRSGEVKEEVIRLFTEVKLPDPLNIFSSYPHQLSGGQRQRLMIAMAVITKPDLLIADEPTTALDVTVQKKILDLLRELKDNHQLSIVFITHDLRLLKEFADYHIIMREGQVVEAGNTEEIFSFPRASYTKGLIACQPPLTHKPARLLTVSDFEKDSNSYAVINELQDKRDNLHKREPLVELNKVSVFYTRPSGFIERRKAGFKAVDSLNLIVYKGETLGIVGESGCGKTSLGKAILGLIPLQGGQILFKGVDIKGIKGKELVTFRKKVQVVFQDPYSSLNPLFSIGTMLTEPMKVHFKNRSKAQLNERAAFLMEKVGLSISTLSKYPHQFSGGQRQRIGIARALALEPELIILDESVSALDVSVQAQILNLLNDLKKDFGLTYIFISHDLAVVKYMSDRIIVMKEGKIEESGEAESIYLDPESDYTKSLIESIPGRWC